MTKKRLQAVLQDVRDPSVRPTAFMADTLIASIREGGIHLIVFDSEAGGDSLDRLAALKKRITQ